MFIQGIAIDLAINYSVKALYNGGLACFYSALFDLTVL